MIKLAIYVCSDIHGEFNTWSKLMRNSDINLDKGDKLYILGDLIDRGKDSLNCVTTALKLKEYYPDQVVYLMGNHELMLINFLYADPKDKNDFQLIGEAWVSNGGLFTISSFLKGIPQEGSSYEKLITVHELIWKKHGSLIKKLAKLPYFHIDGDYVFVHAGFKSNVPLYEQRQEDMVWIRDEFFESFTPVSGDELEQKTIIHGHTPLPYIEGYDGTGYFTGKHHICIDGGSAMKRSILLLKIDGSLLSYKEEAVR